MTNRPLDLHLQICDHIRKMSEITCFGDVIISNWSLCWSIKIFADQFWSILMNRFLLIRIDWDWYAQIFKDLNRSIFRINVSNLNLNLNAESHLHWNIYPRKQPWNLNSENRNLDPLQNTILQVFLASIFEIQISGLFSGMFISMWLGFMIQISNGWCGSPPGVKDGWHTELHC